MLLVRYLIRNPLKELYWTGNVDPCFTMYPVKGQKFKTAEEAEAVLPTLPNGVYLIDKLYVKIDG